MLDHSTLLSTVDALRREIETLHRSLDVLRRDVSNLRVQRDSQAATLIRQNQCVAQQRGTPARTHDFLPALTPALLDLLVGYMQSGAKIQAIKTLREAMEHNEGEMSRTWGLADSKRFVEHLHRLVTQSV